MRQPPPCLTALFLVAAAVLAGATPREAAANDPRRTALVDAVERAKHAVVNIRGEKSVIPEGRLAIGDSHRRVNGMGSGVVIDPRGYVITNFHVVDGVRRINVTLSDGQKYVAKLLARDEGADLALIKIDGADALPVIDVGNSDDLMLAEPVVAVGNPFGYEHTVTQGIISSLRRTVQVTESLVYKDLIQTDAPINPGNSGGPLLNAEGRMIGVVVAVRAGAQGIAFAIPVDRALEVASTLLASGANNVRHGLEFREQVTDGAPRLVVAAVSKDSPAERSGLDKGDVITSVDGAPIHRWLDLARAFIGRQPGEDLLMHIRRDGEAYEVRIKLAKRAADTKSIDDRAWRVLGLRLAAAPPETFHRRRTQYRGGLAVEKVRPGSPAANEGIQPGDVMLGMHVWETTSLENISYILKHPDLKQFNPVKFYILRDDETLYGRMRLAK